MHNFQKVIRSFIKHQKQSGFHLISVTDGNGDKLIPKNNIKAAEWICSCDEGSIEFEKNGYRINALAVLGNASYETIADASWKIGTPKDILGDFDNAWTAFEKQWDID